MQTSSSSSSSDRFVEFNRSLISLFTYHSHLHNDLGLSYRNEKGERSSCCINVETQMQQILISIDFFLDYISPDASQHPLIKESVADFMPLLVTILDEGNEQVKILGVRVLFKLVNSITSLVVENLVSDIVNSISFSLSESLFTSCDTILSKILFCATPERERIVWKVLQETKIVDNIINHINGEHFCKSNINFSWKMFTILNSILTRCPSSRFCVWNNHRLMEVLNSLGLEPIHSSKAAILNMYSAIALCDNGAKKLLDSGNSASLQLMVKCMDGLNPDYLKFAAFGLAECFVVSEEGRRKMIESYCEPLVKAIIDGLSNWSLHSENPTKKQIELIKSACCVSNIICWPGKHHSYFWKHGIESVILKLLLPNPHISEQISSVEERIIALRDGLKADFLCELKPRLWDILGGLAAHCPEDFKLKSKLDFKTLITCACIGFVDSLQSTFEIRGSYFVEPVCKSVLLMIYSPSKDIVLQVKTVLSKLLKGNAKKYIKFLLTFPIVSQEMKSISLACFSGLPKYHVFVRDNNGIKILFDDIRGLWYDYRHMKPLQRKTNTSPHFDHNNNMCCYESEDEWIGGELFTVMLAVAELIRHNVSPSVERNEIMSRMHDICLNHSASGPRWYAAFILSHFGVYGFPSIFGHRIGNVLSNSGDINVDDVVVRIRCKQLQSARDNVDGEALEKLLEYVYKGYLVSENQDVVKSLKKLATELNLQELSQMLDRSRPIWRTPFPRFDLTCALEPGSDAFSLSDIVLVPKWHFFDGWKCGTCTSPDPHLHAHKAILCVSCEYICGMIRSGMQESRANCIKADLGWEALVRLVNWFYSGEIVPRPRYDCLWRNLIVKEKIKQIFPYVELYCLSDHWCLEDVKQKCKTVITTFLDSVHITIKLREAVEDSHETGMIGLAALELGEYIGNILTSLEKTQLQGDT